MVEIKIHGIDVFPLAGDPMELTKEEVLFLGELAELGLGELLAEKRRTPAWPNDVVRTSAVVAQMQGEVSHLEAWGIPGAARILKGYLFHHMAGSKVFDGGRGLTIARELLAKIGRAYWTILPSRETLVDLGIYELVYKH